MEPTESSGASVPSLCETSVVSVVNLDSACGATRGKIL